MQKYTIAFIATEDYAYRRIIKELKTLGHKIILIKPDELALSINSQDYKLLFRGKELFADCIMHKMSTDFKDGLVCLEAVKNKYFIFNQPEATLRSANKYLTAVSLVNNNVPIPRAFFTQNNHDVSRSVKEIGYPIIIKQPDGAEGDQVALVNKGQLKTKLSEVRKFGKAVVVQRFVSESFGQDIRVIVANDQVIAAMNRVQTNSGEFRANIHKGAIGQKVTLTKEEELIAIAATKAVGLDFAGVDILRSNDGPVVIETNSFPGLKGIEKASGVNVARAVVEAMINKLEEDSANYRVIVESLQPTFTEEAI